MEILCALSILVQKGSVKSEVELENTEMAEILLYALHRKYFLHKSLGS
jgi:hypothetical protein